MKNLPTRCTHFALIAIYSTKMVQKGIRISEKYYTFVAVYYTVVSRTNNTNMSNSILDYLINLDKSLTVFFNYNGGSVQDSLWYGLSSRLIWVLPALLLLCFLIHKPKKWKEATLVILALVLVITLCDQISSSIMKPYFARLRPSHTPGVENMLHYVNGYRGGQYGFASSHAANSFGAVTFVALLLRRWKVTVALLLLSLCVCYSRIYLGVHFFGDIFVGAVIGVMFGYIVYAIVSADWSAAYRHIAHFRFRTALR